MRDDGIVAQIVLAGAIQGLLDARANALLVEGDSM
jgi:hypothetical protein